MPPPFPSLGQMTQSDDLYSMPAVGDDTDDLDRIELGRLTGSGAFGFGLPSFQEQKARMARDAMRDRDFLRSYFGVPQDLLSDQNFLGYARMGAAARGRALQPRQNWWDNPREIADAGYRSLLADRGVQSSYMLNQYGFDPFSGQIKSPLDTRFLQAAAAHGQSMADAQRSAGMLGRQYGDQFSLTGQPGQGDVPFGYRRYTDEFGNTVLVDGRGNIVR